MAPLTRTLVTGADGFVGRALVSKLRAQGHSVVAVARKPGVADTVVTGDLADYSDWAALLSDVGAIVHLAARAHIVRGPAAGDLAEFRRVNVGVTVQLARAAAAAGVERFVFLSSIGVNGIHTTAEAFSESDTPDPSEPYAISKWEAEQGLLDIGARSKLRVTRVRPPLIVGPGVKGNLLRLMKLVDLGVPLPLGAIRNCRSFVSLDDLCDLLCLCISDARAGSELFLAANEEPMSTPELMRVIAATIGRNLRLPAVPMPALRVAAALVGAGAQLERLASSLLVDASHARTALEWRSRTALPAAIEAMAQAYRRQ